MAVPYVDNDGFVEFRDQVLSKAGVYEYLGSEIGAPNPDEVYYVLRPPSELSDPETIESFKLKPWVIEHTMIGKKHGVAPEQKGIHGTTGEQFYYDADTDQLKGNIKIFSDSLGNAIDYSDIDELSLGYACVYEFETGTFNGQRYNVVQRRLRGNHLASVPESRMEITVGDNAIAMDALTIKINKEGVVMAVKDKAVQSKGQDMEMKEEDSKDMEKGQDMEEKSMDMESMTMAEMMKVMEQVVPMMQKMMEMVSNMGAGNSESEENMDEYSMDKEPEEKAMDAKMTQKIKSLEDEITKLKAGMDAKSVMNEISQRDSLANKISQHVGTFDHSSMTLAEVAKYGTDKLEIPCYAGSELSAIKAALHVMPTSRPVSYSQSQGLDHQSGVDELDKAFTGQE